MGRVGLEPTMLIERRIYSPLRYQFRSPTHILMFEMRLALIPFGLLSAVLLTELTLIVYTIHINVTHLNDSNIIHMVHVFGFEPKLLDPQTSVLPLHYDGDLFYKISVVYTIPHLPAAVHQEHLLVRTSRVFQLSLHILYFSE